MHPTLGRGEVAPTNQKRLFSGILSSRYIAQRNTLNIGQRALPRAKFGDPCIQGWQFVAVRINFGEKIRCAGTVREICGSTGTVR